jgi:hypothetical protein
LCSGYQRERVFIVNQARHPKAVPQKSDPGSGDSAVSTPKKERSVRSSSHTKATTVGSSKQLAKRPKQRLVPPHSKVSAAAISLVPVYRQQLLDHYIRRTVPDSTILGADFVPWIYSVASLTDHPPALAEAITAVTLSKLATDQGLSTEKCSSVRKASLEHYTSGIWELQKALWDSVQMRRDETLAACLLLAAYELVECPAGDRIGYLCHQDGAARLVQLRGPQAHIDGFGHVTFTMFRHTQILHALDRHRTVFLTESVWKEVPYSVHPRSMGDLLWDKLADAAGIFKRTDAMQRSKPEVALCTAVEVLEYCWKTSKELDDWYAALKASVPGPLFWPQLAKRDIVAQTPTSSNEDDGPDSDAEEMAGQVFPVAYHFVHLRMAMLLTTYWALRALMANGMMLLYSVLATIAVDRHAIASLGPDVPATLLRGVSLACPAGCPCACASKSSAVDCSTNILNHDSRTSISDCTCTVTFDLTTLPPLGEAGDFMRHVRDVCQSVEYCMQSEMRDLGWTSVVAPLTIVVETIKEYPACVREREWCRAVLRGFRARLPYLKCFWFGQ